jgi:DNA-binding Lrp family transcriptional regulator
MGSALWEFLWLIDKVTREEDGRGLVLGGKPITCAEIAEDLGVSERSVSTALQRLRGAGYIETHRRPVGVAIVVLKSKKRAARHSPPPPRTAETCGSETKTSSDRYAETCGSDTKVSSGHSEESCVSLSSHDMYRDITEDSTKYRPIDNLFQEIETLPEEERRELELQAIRDMASQPFPRNFLVETRNGYILGPKPAGRMVHRVFTRMAYEKARKGI